MLSCKYILWSSLLVSPATVTYEASKPILPPNIANLNLPDGTVSTWDGSSYDQIEIKERIASLQHNSCRDSSYNFYLYPFCNAFKSSNSHRNVRTKHYPIITIFSPCFGPIQHSFL